MGDRTSNSQEQQHSANERPSRVDRQRGGMEKAVTELKRGEQQDEIEGALQRIRFSCSKSNS